MNARKCIATLAAAPLLAAATALAAGGDGYRAPKLDSSFPVTAIVFALVFLAGVCTVGFRDARRKTLK